MRRKGAQGSHRPSSPAESWDAANAAPQQCGHGEATAELTKTLRFLGSLVFLGFRIRVLGGPSLHPELSQPCLRKIHTENEIG